MSSTHPSHLPLSNDSLDDVVKRLVAKVEKHDGRANRYIGWPGRRVGAVSEREDQRLKLICRVGADVSAKKSLPLSSTTTKAGKSSTSIFQTASMPSSGYSRTSTLRMQSWARRAAGPPIEPR